MPTTQTAMDKVLEYLLDTDPAIRWQVLRDLIDADPAVVEAERARIATEGWGAQLLSLQGADGHWDGGSYRPSWADQEKPFFDAWTATHFSLQQLADFGIDPTCPEAVAAIQRVSEKVRWDYEDKPYFDGEIEPCVNGVALYVAVRFQQDARPMVETLLSTQLKDGGWNCWDEDGTSVSSFHPTICALEGLRAWLNAGRDDPKVSESIARAEEYLLARRLLFRRSTGELIDPRFGMLSYPVRWYYDILRALDYFRVANVRDPRLHDAVELLRAKQLSNGLFLYENRHEGPTHFGFKGEFEGFPSRWITLRALRVLRWWDQGESRGQCQAEDESREDTSAPRMCVSSETATRPRIPSPSVPKNGLATHNSQR